MGLYMDETREEREKCAWKAVRIDASMGKQDETAEERKGSQNACNRYKIKLIALSDQYENVSMACN